MHDTQPSRSGRKTSETPAKPPTTSDELSPEQQRFAEVVGRLLARRWREEVERRSTPECEADE